MRDQRLTALRNGVLTALGLLSACGGQVDGKGIEPGDGAAALTPGAVPSIDPMAAERAACSERYPGGNDAAGAGAASECSANAGTACDAAAFISEAAAVCIAELEGLEEGLGPWSVSLSYHHGYGRVVRSVTNTLYGSNDNGVGGRNLTIDATTGVVLDDQGWAGIPGRPFLIDREPRTADAIRRADYSASPGVLLDGISAELRAALAAEWTRVGLLEHASVAAFARFALQLLGLGAPPDLLEACQRAMQDELRHTRIAFGLASDYADVPLGPGPLRLDGALDDSIDMLEDVAMATLVEGCIGETIAALDVREGAAHAVDVHVQRALAEIAADEERHAELAWRFLDWALAQRPSLAPQLLARARAQLARASRLTPEPRRATSGTEAALLAHGILSREQKLELEAQALEHVIVPCLVALASKHASASPGADRPAYLA